MGKSIMIFIAGFLIIAGIQIRNMNTTVRFTRSGLYAGYEKIMAANISNSGLEFAISKLTQNPDWRAGLNDLSFSGGRLTVTVLERPDISEYALEINSYSAFNGTPDSSNVLLTAVPVSNRFSRFSYFSNTEPTIWFYSLDTLHGPVHTNGQFHMSGTPVFYGLVSSSSSTYATLGYTDPQFHGGTNFGRESIELEPDMSELQYAAQNGGHLYLNNTLYIKFRNDGSYEYRTGAYGSWQTAALPTNGVISSNRSIYVEGVVNGSVTLATTGSIYVTNDLEYADDPEINPESDDILGLVALNDIVVKDNPENRIECRIQAVMLARNGSFKAEYTYFQPAGRLKVYGGIVQERRGAVGRMTSPPSGFKKYYRYDERMETLFPPFYPVAGGAVSNLTRKAIVEIICWIV